MYIFARIIFFTCFCLTVAATAAEQQTSIQDLSWLTGCWEGKSGQSLRDENWSKPAGETMLGVGRAVVNGKTTEYEFMRIHQESDGIYFTAQPSGQPIASFKLKSLKNNEAIFENPTHDFPQRVIYRLSAADSLVARIEGEMKGKQRGIDFPFQRAACAKVTQKEAANVH